MSTSVLADELRRHAAQSGDQRTGYVQDTLPLREATNPLSVELLREIETELVSVTGVARAARARVTVCDREQFEQVITRCVPRRLRDRGLASHMRVITDPRDPHHVFVGPTALSGLNDRHTNVVTDLVYQLIAATGGDAPLAFERGAADMIAEELSARLGLALFADQYPEEKRMLAAMIDAVRDWDRPAHEYAGELIRAPRTFFGVLRASGYYDWWTQSVAADPATASYTQLIETMFSRTVRLDTEFMDWARSCAQAYADYRAQQRENALSGAAKRAAAREDAEDDSATAARAGRRTVST